MDRLLFNLNLIIQNPIISVIVIILTVINFILTIIFYKNNKDSKSIFYSFKSKVLIEDSVKKIKELEILFSKKNIDRLVITNIVFWNSSKKTINNEDIPVKDKISIIIDTDFYFLDASIIKVVNIINNVICELSEDRKVIHIYFDYVDKNEGFVIQILHTGIQTENLIIKGSVKGFGKIFKGKYFTDPKIKTNILSEFIFYIIYLIPGIIYFNYIYNNLIIIVMYFIFTLLFIWKMWFFYRSRLPKALKNCLHCFKILF